MRRLFAAMLACTCLAPITTRADDIVLYGNSSQPPKAWLDGSTPRGFVVEAAELALKRAGYTVEIRMMFRVSGARPAVTRSGSVALARNCISPP